MFNSFFHFAFIGPGGPEFIVIMLVLLMMFGAKDAPRILRKLNEMLNQIRNTADGFKREVMYGDLKNEASTFEPPDTTDESDSFDADYYDYGEDDGGDGDSVQPAKEVDAEVCVEEVPEADVESVAPEDEDGDVQKA